MDAQVFQGILEDIKQDTKYKYGIKYSIKNKRKSISIRDHITDLETNLNYLCKEYAISNDEYWALMLIIHTHDTMKMHAVPHAKINDKYSHSTLARDFVSDYCKDPDVLAIIQNHEIPFALYRKYKKQEDISDRLNELFDSISNWRLFLIFLVIDNCISGSSRSPVYWIIEKANERFFTGIDDNWVIN